ncbi:MAG: LSU ribosomal protein L6p (L9e), partial [uncultured Solirubrobacterales bacterium]
ESHRKAADPRPRGRQRADRARDRPGERSQGGALGTRLARDGGRAERRRAAGQAPDRPRRAPRPARADPHADRQHGHRGHRRLREAAGDPGRRLPRGAQGNGHRAPGRLLAPGRDRRSRGHRVRGARADADRRARVLEAARRRDRRPHPQGPQARALQGQGHPLRRRAGRAQGGQARM